MVAIVEENFQVKDYLYLPRLWLKIVGSWNFSFDFLPENLRFIGRFIANCYRLFIFINLAHIETLLLITSYKVYVKDGLIDAFLFFVNVIVFLWVVIVDIYYVLTQKGLEKVFVLINEGFRYRSAPGLTYVTIDSGYNAAVKFHKYWHVWVIFVVNGYASASLFSKTLQLPLPVWYPFDLDVGNRFLIIWIIQYIAQFYLGILYATAIGVVMYTVILFISQFDILCASIKNIPYTALIKAGIDKRALMKLQDDYRNTPQELNQYSMASNIELFEDIDQLDLKIDASKTFEDFKLTVETFNDPKVAKCLKEAIVDCIEHHIAISDQLKKFEKQMSVLLLIKYGDINLLLAIILFAILISEEFARKFALGCYLCCPIFELTNLSYFGQVLTLQSTRVIESVINSDWHLYMMPVKKELSIMLARGVQPFVLTAGHLVNITASSFISVVKLSFSYYTLLEKFKK
ncbi:odorant receptor 83a-like [Culicoides brevitarsis]|uniref:odorant receptor 83a-like n=1 Tax=Culicoides brevitarsis TaxID=469753 RepID=UPI00307B4563